MEEEKVASQVALSAEELASAAPHPARVIVEMAPDGKLSIEYYRNGQKSKIALNRGMEFWEILDELHAQRKHNNAAHARKIERAEEISRLRHRKVWIQTAEDHGAGFAAKHIGGKVPQGYGRYLEQEKAPKPKAESKPKTSLAAVLSLLDD